MSRSESNVQSEHLPLKPAVFHILLGLLEGDSHGYGIILRVREHSGGLVDLPTGAFYRHLAWLMKHGFLEESAERPGLDDARRGAYYRLTDRGRQVLEQETERLDDVVAVARAKGLLSSRKSA
jgi:DNA-binding PadR family transcriptional regulator